MNCYFKNQVNNFSKYKINIKYLSSIDKINNKIFDICFYKNVDVLVNKMYRILRYYLS